MDILLLAAAIAVAAYGLLTAFAGFQELRQERLQRWAALSTLLVGLLILVAAGLLATQSAITLTVLLVGLVAMHLLAINNGYRLFGGLTISHHLTRLAISILLYLLSYYALQ